VGIASSTEVLLDSQKCYFNRFVKDLGSVITENLEVEAKEGKSYEIVKLSVLVSSRENVEDIFKSSISKLERAKELGVERLLSEHIEEYDKLWDAAKVEVIVMRLQIEVLNLMFSIYLVWQIQKMNM